MVIAWFLAVLNRRGKIEGDIKALGFLVHPAQTLIILCHTCDAGWSCRNMSSTRPKEELIIHAGSAKGSWEILIAVGLWEERWSQSPFFLSSYKLKIAGYLDFGQMFQSWIVFCPLSQENYPYRIWLWVAAKGYQWRPKPGKESWEELGWTLWSQCGRATTFL